MQHLRVAVDIGGTFTDICVLDERSGALRIAKVPSLGMRSTSRSAIRSIVSTWAASFSPWKDGKSSLR